MQCLLAEYEIAFHKQGGQHVSKFPFRGGALPLALRATRAEDDLLYLGDNESVRTDVNKWVGEGGKATLANAPNADILAEIIEKL